MQKIENLINKFLGTKRAFWVFLILLFVFARLAVWFYPYDSDHWVFYYVGKAIANGQLLYVDAWDHKPPLIFEFNAFLHLLFGGNLVLHRIFLTLLAILDIFLFYKLAGVFSKEFFKENAERITRAALILYVFFRNLSQFASSGNNTENIGLIFLLLMFLAFFKFYKDKKLSYLFLSGVCLSVLFYLKGNFLVLSLPILIEILLLSYKSIKKFFVNYIVFGAPLIIQTAFWLLYFKLNGALNDFFVATFLFSSRYAKSAWNFDVSPRTIFVFIVLPLFVPLLFFTIKYLFDIKKIKSVMLYRFVLFALLAGLFAGFGVGTFYPYYFLIGLPIFILVFIYGGNLLKVSKDINLLLLLVLFAGMAFSAAISYKQFLNSFTGPAKAELNEYQQIADYVKANTSEDDKIIAYTYGAVLYRMAERDSGSRFISASVLLLDERDNYGFHLSDTFISDVERSKPKYWIVAKDNDTLYTQNKKVFLYILNNSSIEKEFDNYMVLRNKN